MDTFEIPLGIAEVEIETVETTQGGDFVITVGSAEKHFSLKQVTDIIYDSL